MDDELRIYEEIKKELTSIKCHGGYIDQYDQKLFKLFVEAYRSGFIASKSFTADSITDKLASDNEYQTSKNKCKYQIDDIFYTKWLCWTEAFTKGFTEGYLKWAD